MGWRTGLGGEVGGRVVRGRDPRSRITHPRPGLSSVVADPVPSTLLVFRSFGLGRCDPDPPGPGRTGRSGSLVQGGILIPSPPPLPHDHTDGGSRLPLPPRDSGSGRFRSEAHVSGPPVRGHVEVRRERGGLHSVPLRLLSLDVVLRPPTSSQGYVGPSRFSFSLSVLVAVFVSGPVPLPVPHKRPPFEVPKGRATTVVVGPPPTRLLKGQHWE